MVARVPRPLDWHMAAGAAGAAALAVLGIRLAVSLHRDLTTPADRSRTSYVRSATCRRCHPEHTASWRRTFHRSMTREATAASVVGDFSGVTVEYQGVTSRIFTAGGRRFLETLTLGGTVAAQEVVRAVGSRRYPQYLTRRGDRFVRLPIVWSLEERRWIHLNGAFLDADGTPFWPTRRPETPIASSATPSSRIPGTTGSSGRSSPARRNWAMPVRPATAPARSTQRATSIRCGVMRCTSRAPRPRPSLDRSV